MKTRHYIILLPLLLCGCSDKPKLKELPDQLAKLSPAGQVAAILSDAADYIAIAAIIFAANGSSLVKYVKVKASEKK